MGFPYRGDQRGIPDYMLRAAEPILSPRKRRNRFSLPESYRRARTPGFVDVRGRSGIGGVEPESSWVEPVTRASIQGRYQKNRLESRRLGVEAETAAQQGPSLRDAVQGRKKPKGRASLLSAEGRRRHPLASSVVAGLTYGARAGDVMVHREQRLRALEKTEEKEGRRREALKLPLPSGYARDPGTGHALRLRQKKQTPTPEKIKEMEEAGYIHVPAKGKFFKKPKGEKPEYVPTAKELKDMTARGQFWDPSQGGFRTDPTREAPRKPTSYEREKYYRGQVTRANDQIQALRIKTEELRVSLAETERTRDADADPAAYDPQIESQKRAISQFESAVEGMERELAVLEENFNRSLPEAKGMTVELFNDLPPDEQEGFLLEFRHPKFNKPKK